MTVELAYILTLHSSLIIYSISFRIICFATQSFDIQIIFARKFIDAWNAFQHPILCCRQYKLLRSSYKWVSKKVSWQKFYFSSEEFLKCFKFVLITLCITILHPKNAQLKGLLQQVIIALKSIVRKFCTFAYKLVLLYVNVPYLKAVILCNL